MSLDSFFNPKSIAVVGVSNDPAKLGAVVFNNVIDAGFEGKLYAINPKCAGQELYGKPCYASVRDLPEAMDLVVVVVPAKFTMPVIDDAIANKTKNISIITAGFGETNWKTALLKNVWKTVSIYWDRTVSDTFPLLTKLTPVSPMVSLHKATWHLFRNPALTARL